MTAVLLPNGKQQYFTTAGLPAVGYKVATFAAGTSTPQLTWQDALKVAPQTNPIILDGRGEASIFWEGAYKVQLQDSTGAVIWTQDGLQSQQNGFSATLVPATNNAIDLGTAVLSWRTGYFATNVLLGPNNTPAFDAVTGNIGYYARTAAEIAAGVTPVSYSIPNHLVSGIINPERYGVNTTPGTTDMGPAWNNAIQVALATSGSGKLGCPIRWVGAHSIATPLAWGALGVNIVPVEVAGYGIASQLICNTTAGSGPLFPLDTLNGWYLHDFLICGNSIHKNDGIHAGNVSSTEAIEWRVERVISLMAGVGLKIQNTNTGWVTGFAHWPGNNPALIVPQTVTATDINHAIYLTGSFVHNVYLGIPNVPPNANYAPGMRGIKCDAQFSFGVTIIMPLVQTLSGNGTETGIDYNCSGQATALTIQGAYHEGAIIALQSVANSSITSATGGGVGVAIVLTNACRQNKISACNIAVLDITDSTCTGNSIDCCFIGGPQAWSAAVPYLVGNYVSNGGANYKCILANTNQAPPNATYWSVFSATAFNDAAEGNNLSGQPNQVINSFVQGFNLPSLSTVWRKNFGPGAAFAPDVYNANWNTYRLQGATLTVSAPLHPRNGQRVGFTIRNETVGAVTVTWSGFNTPPWTNPATGQKRSIEFIYNSDFAGWDFLWYSNADSPN